MRATDEQVEAAAKAMWDSEPVIYSWGPPERHKGMTWEVAIERKLSGVPIFRAFARAALTAALARPAEGDEVVRLRGAIAAIQRATVAGKVCDDVAWFDGITTLFDFCEQILNPPPGSTSRPAQAEEGWKPIETAPKEADWLAGYYPGSNIAISFYWDDEQRAWVDSEGDPLHSVPPLYQVLTVPRDAAAVSIK